MDPRQMMSIFAIFALIILMGQYARAEHSTTYNHPKPNLQKLKVKLQNLLGPNDMDNRNNGVKSKSVVIPIVKSSGILDTFSLSFVGNLNFSNAIQGLQKIVEGLASFIDMKFIRATVDVVLDRFYPGRSNSNNRPHRFNRPNGHNVRPTNRIDEDAGEQVEKEELKGEITTVVGAVLGKQQCWERTACTLGKRTKSFAAKDLFFMLAEKAVPSMRDTLNLVRGGSEDSINCGNFDCSPSERPRIPDHDQAISRHMPVDIES